ncbi:MAG: purine-binding chemotaxis protein CheW [bacterium]|jgi:purine-binding chemotaxis protein CheW
MEYITFNLNEQTFGIPIYVVQEFTRSLEMSKIVGHDPRIAGLVNLRGRIAVAINLKRCLGLPETEDDLSYQKKKMIILETNNRLSEEAIESGVQSYEEPLVLIVDQILDVITVEPKNFYPPPAHIQEKFVEGVAKQGENLLSMLSIYELAKELAGEEYI